jgi:hypothetical protein
MRLSLILLVLYTSVLYGYAQNKNYPVPPETNKRLFYIQRNHNANTIVYDARFDENGKLNEKEPIDVYWIRYEEQGQRMELRNIEKWYAYGVDCKKPEGKTFFIVELAADKKRTFYLHQTEKFKAVITTLISGKISVLKKMYIFADNSGVWPTVKYIELFGKDLNTGVKTYQKIIVDKDGI